MPRDVQTRWNSTYKMLDYAMENQEPITLVTQDLQNGLRKYELSKEEWEIAGQLRDVLKVGRALLRLHNHVELTACCRACAFLLSSSLPSSQVFLDATLYFSQAAPTIALVIPAMDKLDQRLATDSIDCKYKPCVRAAVVLAKETINKYYGKTDECHIYRIAMSTWHAAFLLELFC